MLAEAGIQKCPKTLASCLLGNDNERPDDAEREF